MDLNSFFDKLRGRNADEEDENQKKAEAFEQGPGRGAPNAEEEPVRQIGDETQAEKLQNSKVKLGMVPFGLGGGMGAAAAETGETAAASGLTSKLGNAMPEANAAGKVSLTPAQQAAAAEQMRTQGYAHLFDGEGKLVRTVGQDHPLGKKLLQMGQANKQAANSASPGLSYSPMGKPTTFPGGGDF